MRNFWKQIEEWLEKNCPHLKEELNTGVSQREIETLESKLNVSLPADFLEFYKVHNGQNSSEGLFELNVLLPFDRIVNDWKVYADVFERGDLHDEDGNLLTVSHIDKGIKNNWWNPKWIPITSDARGENVCMDLDPSEEGTVGQIIDVFSNIDGRLLLSGSFRAWIEKYVSDLEMGRYIYIAQFGVVKKDSVFAQ